MSSFTSKFSKKLAFDAETADILRDIRFPDYECDTKYYLKEILYELTLIRRRLERQDLEGENKW